MNQRYSKTTYLALCGLFTALTAICSVITIPLGFTPIPMNLGTLAVFLTGGILDRKYGTLSMSVYVLLGAAGVPVFSGFRGGIGVLAGPTGGYMIGYIAAVFIIATLMGHTADARLPQRQKLRRTAFCAISLMVGLTICYVLGTLWFVFITDSEIWAALTACVLPFLVGDALKIAAASILIMRLRRHLI